MRLQGEVINLFSESQGRPCAVGLVLQNEERVPGREERRAHSQRRVLGSGTEVARATGVSGGLGLARCGGSTRVGRWPPAPILTATPSSPVLWAVGRF